MNIFSHLTPWWVGLVVEISVCVEAFSFLFFLLCNYKNVPETCEMTQLLSPYCIGEATKMHTKNVCDSIARQTIESCVGSSELRGFQNFS